MGEDLGHVVYRGPEGETTVWDDVQRRFGNKPPLPEKFVPRAYAPEEDRGLRAAVERDGRAGGVAHVDAAGGTDALEAMEDEDAFADDGFLEEYRRKRLEEMKTAAAIPRFGAVVEITRDSFMAHVTDPVVLTHDASEETSLTLNPGNMQVFGLPDTSLEAFSAPPVGPTPRVTYSLDANNFTWWPVSSQRLPIAALI